MSEEPRFLGELGKFFAAIEPRISRLTDQLEREEFTVLVWGPGAQGQHWEKRCQIRDTLNAIPGITAFFPEDETGRRLSKRLAAELKVARKDTVAIETAMNATADLILALEASLGPINEVAHFSANPSVRGKIVSLLPQTLEATQESSFPGMLRQGITKRYYTDEELNECTLATRICVEQVCGERLRQRAMTS